MAVKTHLTVGEIARLFSVPIWKVRRTVDRLPDEIPRAGRYRLVPSTLLVKIAAQLDRDGYAPKLQPAEGAPDAA